MSPGERQAASLEGVVLCYHLGEHTWLSLVGLKLSQGQTLGKSSVTSQVLAILDRLLQGCRVASCPATRRGRLAPWACCCRLCVRILSLCTVWPPSVCLCSLSTKEVRSRSEAGRPGPIAALFSAALPSCCSGLPAGRVPFSERQLHSSQMPGLKPAAACSPKSLG